MENLNFTVENTAEDMKISDYMKRKLGFSSSLITKVKFGGVCLNGEVVTMRATVKNGDTISVSFPTEESENVEPICMPLDILYEDGDILIINKPSGMVVHPAPGNMEGTLVNALLFRCKDSLSGINGKLRPGIVHRLDKDTSGLIICAKTDKAHLIIAEDIKEHRYEKRYQAIIYGHMKQTEGTVKKAIGRSSSDRKKMAAFPWDSPNSKNAVTHYRVIEEFSGYSLLELLLETGRTHQIRVHLQSEGHPIVADPVYAPGREAFGLSGQCLHAYSLKINHPITKQEMTFVSPLPPHFEKVLGKIR